MIPVSLGISGFLSYKDPAEIDFTSFDLACISGQNGSGKSSILDAMTWSLFGRARKHDESIINIQSETAQVSFTFQYEGNLYRVIRTNPRGKTSSLEFHIQQSGPAGQSGTWKPLTESSLRETDQKIEDTLRLDYETFINAAFFLQGEADQFTQKNPADRKRILSQILSLEIWETFRKKTFQRRREVELETTKLDGRTSEIRSELAQEESRRQQLSELEDQLKQAAVARKAQETHLEEIQNYHLLLDEQGKMVNTLGLQEEKQEKKLADLRVRLIPRTEEQKANYQVLDHEEEVREKVSAWEKAKKELAALEKTARKFRADEKERQGPLAEITSEKALLSQELANLGEEEAKIDLSLAKIPPLKETLEAKKKGIAQAEQDLKLRDKQQKKLEKALEELADAKAENPRLHQEMKKLEKRIQDLEKASGADCPLCGQPMPASERKTLIEDLKAQGKEMGDRYRENQTLLSEAGQGVKNLQDEISELSKSEKELRTLNQDFDKLSLELSQLETQRDSWKKIGAKRMKLVQSQLQENTFAEKAHENLKKIDAGLKEIGYDPAQHDLVREQVEQGEGLQEKLQDLEKARAALVPLDREITDITESIAVEREELDHIAENLKQSSANLDDLVKNAPDLTLAEKNLLDHKEQENILQRQLGAAQQKISVLETQKTRLAKLEEDLTSHREKIRLASVAQKNQLVPRVPKD